MPRAKAVDSSCQAFQNAIAILGRPWTGLLLNLLQDGALRFGELEDRAAGIGAKTLSARLKSLERSGIIARQVEGGPPVRVRYSLTRKGAAFGHVARAIEQWGRDLMEEDPHFAPSARRGRSGFRARRAGG